MIEWIMFGALVVSLAANGLLSHKWIMAKDRQTEALYLRDKWQEQANSAEQVNKLLDQFYVESLDDRNDLRRRNRRLIHQIQIIRTDNQVLENTVIAKNNEVDQAEYKHRLIQRDLGKRIKQLSGHRNEVVSRNLDYLEMIECHRAAIRHLSGELDQERESVRELGHKLDKAKANDLRDSKGRFVSRRPKRGTGQRT